jgi:glycosyltransferase involved in cell wall biosynthesis
MHVLILPTSYPRFYNPISGVFFRDQAKALKDSGVTVGVIDSAPRSMKTVKRGRIFANRFHVTTTLDEGFPIVRANDWCLPHLPKIYVRQFVWRAAHLLDRYIERFGRPDVIHAHEILWGGVAARAISARSGIPYVVTEHSGGHALWGVAEQHVPYLESTISGASVVMAVSEDLVHRLLPFAGGREIRVMPNVVDTEFFTPPVQRPQRDKFRFVSIGSLIPDKRIDILLRAFGEAFAGNDNVRLAIGGDGHDRVNLMTLAAGLGLGGRVEWMGALNRQQVRDTLQGADAFVSTSTYESFGVALIEAMAVGLPVISANGGGPKEFVTPDNGYLVEVGQTDQTSEAMRTAYRYRDEWRLKAPSVRQLTVDRFGEHVIAGRLGDVYSEVVGVMQDSERSLRHSRAGY